MSIKTTQHISMYAIVLIDGQLWRKTGTEGDYDIFDAIDYDSGVEVTPVDVEQITEYSDL